MRCLELNGCFFDLKSVDLLNQMFNSFTRLECLQLSSTSIDEMKPKDLKKIKPVNLPHLKKLIMNDSHPAVRF